MSERGEPIDYDHLWADYLRSLVDTLRGFSSGLEALGLEHFVPSDDPTISLRNLLDAAAGAGHGELAVRFGPATRPRVDAEVMRALAAGYGRVRVLATKTDLVIAVEALHPAAVAPRARPPARVPTHAAGPAPTSARAADSSVYASALCAVTSFAHRGALAGPDGLVDLAVEVDDAQLFLHIDANTTVVAAGFVGAPPALLEHFCALITGLPLLEAAHHAVIKLEAALRAPGTRPVPGVVTPRAAHPMFDLPSALIRAALGAYRARTGYAELINRHDPGPGPAWRDAGPDQRAARIAAVASQGVTLVAIEHDVRLVFALPESLDGDARQRLLFDLEARIQRQVDPRLEVHAEERKDRNKLRRLGGKKEIQ